ncbi:PAS domain S-box protein [Oligoflexus tunisiensis]|uniref:PAS domain S-box protein n=1 Tax=Oligoflexus tunisiensis TaxID=708132 RepID=UPI00114D0D01|nr:PAS domain S-box protein [Oligoflexus tunisiensis]
MDKVAWLILLAMGLGASVLLAQGTSILAGLVILASGAWLLHERRLRLKVEEKERLLRDTFEQAQVGIAHVKEDGHWVRLNPYFCRILGYTLEELAGRTFQELTHPDDLNGDLELARKLWRKEIPTYSLEKRYIRKDGSQVWVLLSVSLSLAKDGTPQFYISTVKNISARKQAEAALTESSLQLRLATEAAQLGIWEYDVTTCVNRGCGRLWDQLCLKPNLQDYSVADLYELVHPDDRIDVMMKFRAAANTQSDYVCEYRMRTGTGDLVWLEVMGSPVRDDKGQLQRFVGVARDITDRKLAQLDFQRSVDVSPAILWITEKDGVCTYLSQKWYDLTGQMRSEALGFGWLQAVHEEDRDHTRQAFLTANGNRKSFYAEYRLRTRSGDYRWAVDAGNPRYDSDGNFLGFAGTMYDIHDRKLAQAQLEETAQLFKVLANSIPQMAWMARPTGEMSWYNDRWFTYTGMKPEEITTQAWRNCHHPDHMERVVKKFQQCLARGEIWEDTFPLRSASGEWRWFLSRAVPLANETGKIEQWFGTNTDITELREFQQALVESEARFRDLANSMPQLVWTAGPDGHVDYYNDRAQEYDGFMRSQSGNWDWQPTLHPDDLHPTIETWREAVAQEKTYVCEHRVRMQDGSYCWHLSRANPVKQADGKVKKWYGTATNIHEYKLALQELAKAKETAEEANKAKSRFLANMSHEIRSPMSSVLGYADLLLERGLPEGDRMAYATSIKASGGHLLAIIDDILDLSAVESGEFKIDRHAFAVLDLIAESVNSMAVLAQRKGLDLQVKFESAVPEYLESDPLRLRQILLNLLSNAIKFTERGHILIRLRYQYEFLHLEVEDSGLGIEAGKADKLFRAFSQVDSGISRKFGGTGLGLHLSRRLAQALEGDLRLNWSEPGRGSSFMLNVAAPHAAGTPFLSSFQDALRQSARTSSLAPTAGEYTVLLAEDSPDNQILIKIFLKKLGARVDVAVNGEEAIQLATKRSYDIILMDMMMPIMDGLEATRRLRALGYRKPIVALTAHALKEEVEKTIAAGCDLHLSKPIQMDVLRRTLDRVLNQRPSDPAWEAGLH